MTADAQGTETVEKIVQKYFDEVVELNGQEIKMDAHIFEEYGMKSAMALRLISDIEVEYDIDISTEEAKGITTLNDVVMLIKQKIS